MQRQKSILSFLKKPEPSSAGKPIALDSSDEEIKGIDTPSEKVPRRVFPDSRPSVFSSIKHKFTKMDTFESSSSDSRSSMKDTLGSGLLSMKFDGSEDFGNQCSLPKQLSEQNADWDKDCTLETAVQDDILGPDTPGMRPLVPRLKRVQEEHVDLEDKASFSLPDHKKRAKLQKAPEILKENQEDSETISKFEWLRPSRIKDVNGRKPGDPLYDKRTLYIPPDALRKMSASQRQYWDVKRQYMDVILFFKVGKFYELYELDAEIGHKELDWRITLSGVGKCRQVGVSESGIDDAVQKLIARGYKVGRIEQLETSEQAKSRGSSSVIQRKLIHVLTPATTLEGNIGPDAVHLLAIKEGGILGNGSNAFGFAFVDCAALKFWVGSISDDASCAALEALLMQVCEIFFFFFSFFFLLPDLERLLGRVKSSFQSSSVLLLPSIGNKILKQRVKVFGSLVRGLRYGIQMLVELQKHEIMTSLLSKVISLPMLSGNEGLDISLRQFEAAVDSEFPDHQDHNLTDSEAETFSILMELFVEKATQWSQMIHAISCVDVLRSFAISSNFAHGSMSRPVIIPHPKSGHPINESVCPMLHMKGVWHPYALGESGVLPVPNDIFLGGEGSSHIPGALLLTGPNMGGKSTLLRATCLAVVLAQLGCYVPCEKCTLSTVDIIFTRLGATDRIMTGESTFLIECKETASVLQNATQSSLVLLDELGRGTSTFDGYAIAYAVR
ncbi:DNA mismatch repair protein MSH7 [Striga hermonthica]|uniref:DNA mismatch repair protein MSH7 n=1 Tax=Striga hermonthica TaxID=68872 RepID=A0A9N7MKG2_STRHE|nr:DNA mismatch repair protein MSH7 [Striga hermonthica]